VKLLCRGSAVDRSVEWVAGFTTLLHTIIKSRGILCIIALFSLCWPAHAFGKMRGWLSRVRKSKQFLLIVLLPVSILVVMVAGMIPSNILQTWLTESATANETTSDHFQNGITGMEPVPPLASFGINWTDVSAILVVMDSGVSGSQNQTGSTAKDAADAPEKVEPLNWVNIFMVYLALLFLWWILKSRNNIIVEEFIDYTKKTPDDPVKGLGTLLVVELGRLNNLFQEVDEKRAIPTSVDVNPALFKKGRSIDPKIIVKEVEDLTGMVSAESQLELGILKVPVRLIMALLGRVIQGPRIIGSLHKENGNLILTAQLIGGNQSAIWRVSDPKPIQSSNGTRGLDDMVTEMACRVLTHLKFKDEVRWKAVWKFSEGLKDYRDCLSTPKEKGKMLKMAESKFVETLAEDERFDLAYYNLGVVYTELGNFDAANVAFSRSILRNPDRWGAYYAMAINRYQDIIKASVHGKYMFSWDEIPGKGEERLIGFLAKKLDIDWVKTAKIERIDNGKTIKVSDEKSSLSLKLNDKITEVILEIDDLRRDEFMAKMENGKLNIYHRDISKEIEEVVQLCNQLIALNQDRLNLAKAYNLMGLAIRTASDGRKDNHVDDAIPCHECAAKLSLHVLIRAKLKGIEEVEKDLARTCLSNLAVAYIEREIREGMHRPHFDLQSAQGILQLAIKLSPSDAYARFCLGRTYLRLLRYEQAIDELEFAFQVDPSNTDYISYLAEAYSKAYVCLKNEKWKKLAETTCDRFFDYIPKISDSPIKRFATLYEANLQRDQGFDEDDLKRIKDTYERVGETKKAVITSEIMLFLNGISEGAWAVLEELRKPNNENNIKKGFDELENLKGKVTKAHGDEEIGKWMQAEAAHMIGVLRIFHTLRHDGKEAEEQFKDAIEKLKASHPERIGQLRLHAWLAFAQFLQGKKKEALENSANAIKESPFYPLAQYVNARINLELSDFDDANARMKEILDLMPNDESIRGICGLDRMKAAKNLPKFDQKKYALKHAISYFQEALDLYQDLPAKGWCFYWIGKAHILMGDYNKAISNFTIAQSIFENKSNAPPLTGYEWHIVALKLATALIMNNDYSEAEKLFHQVIEGIDKRRLIDDNPDKKLGEFLDETLYLLHVRTMSCLGLANLYGQRSIDHGGPISDGIKYAADAEKLISAAETGSKSPSQTNAIRECKADYNDCMGWLLFRKALLSRHPLKNDTKDAEGHLLESVRHRANLRAYLHLAQLYTHNLSKSKDDDERAMLVNRIEACRKIIRELDPDESYAVK